MKRSQRTNAIAYVQCIFSDWKSKASGGGGVILTALTAFMDSSTLIRQTTGAMAELCVLAATYTAWKKERQQVIDLTENVPKFRGTFTILQVVNMLPASTDIRMEVKFQNLGSKSGVIQLAVTVSNAKATRTKTVPTEFMAMRRAGQTSITFSNMMYDNGSTENLGVDAIVDMPRAEVALGTVAVAVVDSRGEYYQLRRQGDLNAVLEHMGLAPH